MSISFYEEVVMDVQMGTTMTVGEILEHEDEGRFVFYPDCNWLAAEDLITIAQELNERNKL